MSQINVDTIAPATSGRAVAIATPLFILHKPSGNQSISNATGTVVTWGIADVDTHSVSDLTNNRIVITEQTASIGGLVVACTYSARATRMFL